MIYQLRNRGFRSLFCGF